MCTRGPKEGNYEFFDKIEDYIEKVKNAESNPQLSNAQSKFALSNAESKCNSFMEASVSHFTFKSTAKNICEQFVKLYYSLRDLNNCVSSNDPDYKKCREFLNYWVNFKLRESMKNKDDCVNDVYDTLESQITGSVDFDINLDFLYIYDIKKNDLYNMNILYNLYDKYSKLKTIIEDNWLEKKQQILTLSTQCCTDYNYVSYMCKGDNRKNNPEFCNILNDFETKYDELDKKVVEPRYDFSDYFIILSKCPNTKIISTAVTGSIIGLIPLLGGLYKFTPMGQVLRSKMGILNNDIGKNDEEMTNISLMEQENEQLRFQKGTYNIKYQSL